LSGVVGQIDGTGIPACVGRIYSSARFLIGCVDPIKTDRNVCSTKSKLTRCGPPMISIAVLTYQSRPHAAQTLKSLLASVQSLGLQENAEYILIDDCSDASHGIIELFKQFRAATKS